MHSDECSTYRHIQQLGNVSAHNAVNNSLYFVDPVTGVHTQHVESYLNRVKDKLKRMRGCHATQLPSFLNEFLRRERYGKKAGEAWQDILVDTATQYLV